jgi:hypothetical protein
MEPFVFVAAMIAGGLTHAIAFGRAEQAAVKPWFESPHQGAPNARQRESLARRLPKAGR